MTGYPLAVVLLLTAGWASGQTTPAGVRRLLEPALQPVELAGAQLRQYLLERAPRLAVPPSGEAWRKETARLRREILDNVIFHGWPREWVEAPLKAEDLGPIASGSGYRMRKMRYEIVPGLQSVGILYEPAEMKGKAPAILNVNGHVGAPGKSVEYKQKRCINQARQGIVALNLEWLAFGELAEKENLHWFGAHLDLTGANAVGLFYLAMRKGLDYLYQHPNVDTSRIGVTGLSGGGWQTIVLSALDERVQAAVPVAGYSSFLSRVERDRDIGDLEQNPTDFYTKADYPQLTAMRAPRPTLLIYNAEDECCFRAPLVKPYIFDQVLPFFRLFGSQAQLGWHENTDPSDHNYQLDNRVQAYRFFTRHFGLPVAEGEIPVDAEIKSFEELKVGLPGDNLTILGLAKKLSSGIKRRPPPTATEEASRWAGEERTRLREVLRYRPVAMRHAWALSNTNNKGLETRSYRFEFANGLSATGVWLKALAVRQAAPFTLVLHDQGKAAGSADVSDRVNRGEEVLAADLLFTGDAAPQKPGAPAYAQLLAGAGDRPLGLEAAQLIALSRWLQGSGNGKVRLMTTGIRSQVAALAAAALEPELFSEIVVRSGMKSLNHLLEAPVEYQSAPDLFCLDLYKHFDLDRLAELAGGAEPVRRPATQTTETAKQ